MLKSLFGSVALVMFAGSAFAHEFYVTLVVPASSEVEARQAFLLASAERDSHADETSEGHLGGVDSQLEIVVAGQSVPRSDVVVAIGGASVPVGSVGNDVWSFQVIDVSMSARADFLENGGEFFEARYGTRYGAAPTEVATLVYVAARLIDLAVRAQDGVDDQAALSQAISGY